MKRVHPAVVLVPIAAFAAVAILTAQDLSRAESRDRVDLAMVAQIRAEATDAVQGSRDLQLHHQRHRREADRSRAHKQAADYVRAKLTEWGLANSHLEPFHFGRGWDLEKFSLELTAPRYFPMFGYPQAWTPSTKGVLAGTPIYVADKTEAEITALGEKLRGAIMLASPPQTVFQLDRPSAAGRHRSTSSGSAVPNRRPSARRPSVVPANAMSPLLQKLGAGAILRPGTELHGTLTVGGSPQTPDGAVPTVIVMAEHYNMIVRMMQAGVAPQLRLELRTAYLTNDLNSYNVLAEIPGEDPVLRNEVVIVGAHLDSLPAGSRRHRQRRRRRRRHRGDAHPEGGWRAAAPHDPRRDLERRGGRVRRRPRLRAAASHRCRGARQDRRLPEQRSGQRRDLRLVHGQQRLRARRSSTPGSSR